MVNSLPFPIHQQIYDEARAYDALGNDFMVWYLLLEAALYGSECLIF